MRREHVVIGADNAKIGRAARLHRRLIFLRPGKGVREIGAGNILVLGRALGLAAHQVEIGVARWLRAFDHAFGDAADCIVEATHAS